MAEQRAAPAGTTPSRPAGNGLPDRIQVVEFIIGNEAYAITLYDVKEVVEHTAITRLPGTPPYVRGIISLRGEITTIVDLAQRLNIAAPGSPPPASPRIIVLDDNIPPGRTGILVDDVTAVSTFEAGQVDASPASAGGGDAALLGIIRRRTERGGKETAGLVIWIDIRRLLAG